MWLLQVLVGQAFRESINGPSYGHVFSSGIVLLKPQLHRVQCKYAACAESGAGRGSYCFILTVPNQGFHYAPDAQLDAAGCCRQLCKIVRLVLCIARRGNIDPQISCGLGSLAKGQRGRPVQLNATANNSPFPRNTKYSQYIIMQHNGECLIPNVLQYLIYQWGFFHLRGRGGI